MARVRYPGGMHVRLAYRLMSLSLAALLILCGCGVAVGVIGGAAPPPDNGNGSAGNCADVPVSFAWNDSEDYDFESNPTDPGFDDPWEYGEPTGGCRESSPCWATRLIGEYGNCEAGAVFSPVLDLSPCAGESNELSLHFWQRYTFEDPSGSTLWDGGAVQFSPDNGLSWQDTAPLPSYDGPIDGNYGECGGNPALAGHEAWSGEMDLPGWQEVIVPVDDSLRTHGFRFRFLFASDRGSTDQGWIVDEIAITLDSN